MPLSAEPSTSTGSEWSVRQRLPSTWVPGVARTRLSPTFRAGPALVAQGIEHRFPKPCVGCSNHPEGAAAPAAAASCAWSAFAAVVPPVDDGGDLPAALVPGELGVDELRRGAGRDHHGARVGIHGVRAVDLAIDDLGAIAVDADRPDVGVRL